MMKSKQQYIEEVGNILENNFYNSASTQTLVGDWWNNKSHFYDIFGGRTIVKSEKISLEAWVEDYQIADKLIEFRDAMVEELTSIEEMHFKSFLSHSIGSSGFKTNKVLGDFEFLKENFKTGKSEIIKINRGTKFSRSLKHFFHLRDCDDDIKEKNKRALRKMQDLYSTYRQTLTSKSDGYLFLSIDPLDFLSTSDNNHNWSSCHTLDHGEYRVGNLSFMVDGVTLVAYYASSDEFNEKLVTFGDIPWNSKRWRTMVHIKPDKDDFIAVYNKEYPFNSPQLMAELDVLVAKTFGVVESSCEVNIQDERLKGNRIFQSHPESHAYLDIGHYSDLKMRMAKKVINTPHKIDPLIIGGTVYCLECNCGPATNSTDGSCWGCSDEFCCQECEGIYYEDDAMYVEEMDTYVCYSCYEALFKKCPKCNEMCGNEGLHYADLRGESLCKNCLAEINSESGAIVFSFNDVFRQFVEGVSTMGELKLMYNDINEEEKRVLSNLKKHYDDVILISVFSRENTETSQQAADLHAIHREVLHTNSNSVLTFNGLFDSPFKSLKYSSVELADIQEIILMGSTDQNSLNKSLTELRISVEALGIIETVKIDYSRVRVL